MVRIILVLLGLSVSVASADWASGYKARHPNKVSHELQTAEECRTLSDSDLVRDCLAEVSAGYKFKAKGGEFKAVPKDDGGPPYTVDEQKTITVAGGQTTMSVTTTKNRSSREVVDALDGIKGTMQFAIAISLVLSVISIIAVFK
ncbi:MAG: hypothetical protein M3Y08_09220 [Fibrobacterota bacterium]|nr:hypothetical protein [Fibrobacterota bacterium]